MPDLTNLIEPIHPPLADEEVERLLALQEACELLVRLAEEGQAADAGRDTAPRIAA